MFTSPAGEPRPNSRHRSPTAAPSRGANLRQAVTDIGHAPVTLTFVGVNLIVAAALAASAARTGYGWDTFDQSPLFDALGQDPRRVYLGEYWRLVTAGFTHANPVHLATNMVSLLFIGPRLERRLGRGPYTFLYLASLLGGAVGIQMFAPQDSITSGASTALFGLLGAAVLCAILTAENWQTIRRILKVLLLNLMLSLLPGVSLEGHLGGLITGLLACALIRPPRRSAPTADVAQMVEDPPADHP